MYPMSCQSRYVKTLHWQWWIIRIEKDGAHSKTTTTTKTKTTMNGGFSRMHYFFCSEHIIVFWMQSISLVHACMNHWKAFLARRACLFFFLYSCTSIEPAVRCCVTRTPCFCQRHSSALATIASALGGFRCMTAIQVRRAHRVVLR